MLRAGVSQPEPKWLAQARRWAAQARARQIQADWLAEIGRRASMQQLAAMEVTSGH
jgi:hypothetical protein